MQKYTFWGYLYKISVWVSSENIHFSHLMKKMKENNLIIYWLFYLTYSYHLIRFSHYFHL